jgi:hypothetical protein
MDSLNYFSRIYPSSLRISPYWYLAGGKLRGALESIPEGGTHKHYPVIDCGQGSSTDTLVIGGAGMRKTLLEDGWLSLVKGNDLKLVKLCFAQPVEAIEIGGLSLSGNPITHEMPALVRGLCFAYNNTRTGLFPIYEDGNVGEIFSRSLTGSFASLALSRAMRLK